jgi:hemolysin D
MTKAIPVNNGSRVNLGDLLVDHDDTELKSDMDGVASELHPSNAEVARREAVVSEVRTCLPDGLFSNRRDNAQGELAFPTDTPNDVIAREQSIYNADLAQLDAAVKNIAAQRDQQLSTIERLTQTIGGTETAGRNTWRTRNAPQRID